MEGEKIIFLKCLNCDHIMTNYWQNGKGGLRMARGGESSPLKTILGLGFIKENFDKMNKVSEKRRELGKKKVASRLSAGVLSMAVALSSVTPALADTAEPAGNNGGEGEGGTRQEAVKSQTSQAESAANKDNNEVKGTIEKAADAAKDAGNNIREQVNDVVNKIVLDWELIKERGEGMTRHP